MQGKCMTKNVKMTKMYATLSNTKSDEIKITTLGS